MTQESNFTPENIQKMVETLTALGRKFNHPFARSASFLSYCESLKDRMLRRHEPVTDLSVILLEIVEKINAANGDFPVHKLGVNKTSIFFNESVYSPAPISWQVYIDGATQITIHEFEHGVLKTSTIKFIVIKDEVYLNVYAYGGFRPVHAVALRALLALVDHNAAASTLYAIFDKENGNEKLATRSRR